MAEKECVVCGNKYFDNSRNQTKKTCGNECRYKYWASLGENHLNQKMRLRFNNINSKGCHLSELEKDEIEQKLQDGYCDICRDKFPFTKLCIDHDHITKKYRGVICDKCNMQLGLIGDSPILAKGISNYLVKHEARGIPWGEMWFARNFLTRFPEAE